MTDLFQHRHFTKMASIIATLPAEIRHAVASEFSEQLRHTNRNYDARRFYTAAMGDPINGRDRV